METPEPPDYDSLETPHPRRDISEKTTIRTIRFEIANYPHLLFFAVALFLCVRFFGVIARELLLFLFALLFAIVLNAPVRLLEKRGVSRGISVAGVAVILIALIGSTAYILGPRLASETVSLVKSAPERTQRLRQQILRQTHDYPQITEFIHKNESSLSSTALSERVAAFLPRLGHATVDLVAALAEGFVIFVVTLYAVANPKPLIKGFLSAIPAAYRKKTTHALTRIVGQFEAWAMATLLMMAVVGIAAGIGLGLLHVPNAFLFGVLAGLGEAVPTVGPIFSALPPFAVAVADEPIRGGYVLLLFLVVQQTESHVLVPWIMSRNLNLHPVSILFFVVALGSTLGVAGALLAVPAAIVTKILYEEFYLSDRMPQPDALEAAAVQILHAGERIPHHSSRPVPPPATPTE